jgi:DNA-binding SARP family transcriptional activator/transcriptional regulator with XRE-family HTH domain
MIANGPDVNPPDRMGMLVKQYRTARGLTQRELANAVGASLGSLRDLEQGRTLCPRWGVMERLAAALDLDGHERGELMRAWQAGASTARGAVDDRGFPGFAVAGVRIDVLGPIAAWVDGAAVPLGSLRQRAVLGLLVLHNGVGLHRDAIIDVLWDANPPRSAVAEVQGYVWRLRKLLGSGRDDRGPVIATVGAGYRLQADGHQLDLAAFRQLVDDAGRAAAQDRPADACDLYERALGLWRGNVLADIDLLRDNPAATEWAHRRSDVVVRYAEVAVRAGIPGRALPRLRELCARECFNETAHAQLMIALAATSQQAAALEEFTKLRRRLDDELGVRPSPEVAEVYARILRQHAYSP